MNLFIMPRLASCQGKVRPAVPFAGDSGGTGGTRGLVLGFTAIELLVVVAIVAIMAAVAMPSYVSVGNRTRARAFANALIRDIQLARSTAIQTGQSVNICPGSNGQCPSSSTGTTSWLGGWYIYKNPSGVATTFTGSTAVGSQAADINSTDTFTATAANLVFNQSGFVPAASSGVTFTFQAGTGTSNKYCVVVTSIGAATLYSGGTTTSLGTAC